MADAGFVKLIRQRAREDLKVGLESAYARVGIRVERGTPLGSKQLGTWVEAKIFVPDEMCDQCEAPIYPGKEWEHDDGSSVLCPPCAEKYHLTRRKKR